MEKASERLYKDLLVKLRVEVNKQKAIVQEEKGEEKEIILELIGVIYFLLVIMVY